jgi:hypothetical protein
VGRAYREHHRRDHRYAESGLAMPRSRNNDSGLANRILVEVNVLGRDPDTVMNAAAAKLAQDQRITEPSAHRRLRLAVTTELQRQGNGLLTGLPVTIRALGSQLAQVARRDGYATARQALVLVTASSLTCGQLNDPELLRDAFAAAEAWVAEIEASVKA